jgi:hypothetical protein
MLAANDRCLCRGRAREKPRFRPKLETLETRASPSSIQTNPFLNVPVEDPVPSLDGYTTTPSYPDPAPDPGVVAGMAAQAPLSNLGVLAPPIQLLQVLPIEPLPQEVVPAPGGNGQLWVPPGRASDEHEPPVIIDFSAGEGVDGMWTFSGVVEAGNPSDLTVRFGGLDSLQGQAVRTEQDGSFRFTVHLARFEEGLATSQTKDWEGQDSNVAEAYVHQSGATWP